MILNMYITMAENKMTYFVPIFGQNGKERINEFSRGKAQITWLRWQLTNTGVFNITYCSFPHNPKQRRSVFCSMLCGKIQRNLDNGLQHKKHRA